MRLSWDEAKNVSNQRKHGISFEEARALFTSDDYLEIFDEEHSETEERFIAVGLIARGLIVVVWTESEEGTIHIISARFATKREERLYESYMGREND
ncbi:MAG: BrnT family toxin [Acidobacteriota bacterium]